MKEALVNWLTLQGMPENLAAHVLSAAVVLAIAVVSFIADAVSRRVIVRGLAVFIRKSKASWDDALLERKVLNRLAHIAPALVVYVSVPLAFPEATVLVSFLRSAAFIYMVVITLLAAGGMLNVFQELSERSELARKFHTKGFVQAAKIVLFFIGGILILSSLTSKSPLFFLSGLGALTAVLMLVFKDAILGFVAGIQLSTNNMVSKGDWIEMPQFGADGDVVDVSLTTVKVQNWDKTVTTIPTYALISQSFRNWQGMQESGGRRIKRSIYIDMSSIRFLDEGMLGRLLKIQYIKEYLDRRAREIEDWNRERHVDYSNLINGRRLTNIGTFRAYVAAYLRNHPMVNQDMTFLIRHLQPTEHGLPLEIYVFSRDKAWANYEAIQADIFDHLLASVPEFDLRVYQSPSGGDFRSLKPHS
jgi:miniconductance mechanosensitive channel